MRVDINIEGVSRGNLERKLRSSQQKVEGKQEKSDVREVKEEENFKIDYSVRLNRFDKKDKVLIEMGNEEINGN